MGFLVYNGVVAQPFSQILVFLGNLNTSSKAMQYNTESKIKIIKIAIEKGAYVLVAY